MRNPDTETRWVPDGRPYVVDFGGAEVEIRITDESGKINLNAAAADELSNLFMSRGMEETEAWHLADAIEDWRDPDELPRLYGAELAEYEAAGYPYGPPNEAFGSVEELQQVIGMSWALYRELEPLLTVHSRGGRLNPAFASADVLAANPDLSREDAELFVEERWQVHPRDQQALMLPDGQMVSLQGGGRTFSIRSRATLETGTWSEIRATVELGGAQRGRPFRVLRWRDNVEDR
jgi:general secretion pathway protein K